MKKISKDCLHIGKMSTYTYKHNRICNILDIFLRGNFVTFSCYPMMKQKVQNFKNLIKFSDLLWDVQYGFENVSSRILRKQRISYKYCRRTASLQYEYDNVPLIPVYR